MNISHSSSCLHSQLDRLGKPFLFIDRIGGILIVSRRFDISLIRRLAKSKGIKFSRSFHDQIAVDHSAFDLRYTIKNK